MLIGPKAEKRPADPIGNAVTGARIATGEAEEAFVDDGKDKAAVALRRKEGWQVSGTQSYA